MPGTDPGEAAALVAGELADLPHLVELPERGPSADMLGRALAICVDLPGEVTPFGWRFARRPGRDYRRAKDYLAWDVDAAEQHYAGAAWVKVQVAGPWTLAAQVETPSGNRAVTDSGALRDIAESLAEGLAAHLAEVGRRLVGTRFVVQIDEPALPEVLAGSLSTASGFGGIDPIPPVVVEELLARLVDSLAGRPSIAHCCHPGIPLPLLRAAGFSAISLDLTEGPALPTARLDQVGEAVEGGTVLVAGLVPTREPARLDPGRPALGDTASGDARSRAEAFEARSRTRPGGSSDSGTFDFHDAAQPLLDLWHRLGLPDRSLAQVVVSPTCGLAGASDAWMRHALTLARDAARLLADRALG